MKKKHKKKKKRSRTTLVVRYLFWSLNIFMHFANAAFTQCHNNVGGKKKKPVTLWHKHSDT